MRMLALQLALVPERVPVESPSAALEAAAVVVVTALE